MFLFWIQVLVVEQDSKIKVDCIFRLILGASDISWLDIGRKRLLDFVQIFQRP